MGFIVYSFDVICVIFQLSLPLSSIFLRSPQGIARALDTEVGEISAEIERSKMEHDRIDGMTKELVEKMRTFQTVGEFLIGLWWVNF